MFGKVMQSMMDSLEHVNSLREIVVENYDIENSTGKELHEKLDKLSEIYSSIFFSIRERRGILI